MVLSEFALSCRPPEVLTVWGWTLEKCKVTVISVSSNCRDALINWWGNEHIRVEGITDRDRRIRLWTSRKACCKNVASGFCLLFAEILFKCRLDFLPWSTTYSLFKNSTKKNEYIVFLFSFLHELWQSCCLSCYLD